MNRRNRSFGAVTIAAAIASGFLMVTTAGYAATENAQERRGARDTKQDSRQSARNEKVDCRQANQKSNAACRHDKRDTKQEGRQDSRAVRAGATPK